MNQPDDRPAAAPQPRPTVRVIFSLPSVVRSRAAAQERRQKETARLAAEARAGGVRRPTSAARVQRRPASPQHFGAGAGPSH